MVLPDKPASTPLTHRSAPTKGHSELCTDLGHGALYTTYISYPPDHEKSAKKTGIRNFPRTPRDARREDGYYEKRGVEHNGQHEMYSHPRRARQCGERRATGDKLRPWR